MAPFSSRQLLVWTLPTIVAVFGYFWYKKKRIEAPSDPGDSAAVNCSKTLPVLETEKAKSPSAPQEIVDSVVPITGNNSHTSPCRSFSRSLSGVESSPIDIVIPRELRSIKTTPIVISDEDLELEIEKVKPMKNTISIEVFNKSRNVTSPANKSKELDIESSSNVELNHNNSPINSNNTNGPNSTNNTNSESSNFSPMLKKSITIEKTPFECKKTGPMKISSGATKNNSKKQKNKNKSSTAQQDHTMVEEKLNPLKLQCDNEEVAGNKDVDRKKRSKSRSNSGCERDELQRRNSERDSANNSPADIMLASPSLSSISDNHSEGSNDSGKGGSDLATPPPSRVPGTDGSISGDLNLSIIYEFVIPQNLVGKLIGKKGAFVSLINNKANAQILVKKHPIDEKLKVCAVEGTQNEIEKALKMIRDRFPPKKFPEITLEQVSLTHPIPTVPLYSDHLYLKLVAGINNDTIMSCLVTPGHLFLQQPTHPTFPNLNILTNYMNICYSDLQSPLLPNPIPANTVCAAYSVDTWFRAMILSNDSETDTSYVKFLDFGGYAYVENSFLRQIRGDFMLLPFQAAECFLANIKPIGESWHEDAYNLVANISKGSLIYTQVIEYTEDDIPLVHCYAVTGPRQLVFLNQELVDQGFAEWIPYEDPSLHHEEAGGMTVPCEVLQQS